MWLALQSITICVDRTVSKGNTLPDLAMMMRHLAQAEQDICVCEQRVGALHRNVERSEVAKVNSEHVRKLHRLLVDALASCTARRLTILKTIARLERHEACVVDLWQRASLAELTGQGCETLARPANRPVACV